MDPMMDPMNNAENNPANNALNSSDPEEAPPSVPESNTSVNPLAHASGAGVPGEDDAFLAENSGGNFPSAETSSRARTWPDFATPLRGVDLLYLLGFYFLAGAVLTLVVAVGTMLFFHLAPSELQRTTGERATVMIVSQALLSIATLVFLYALVRSRSGSPFWNALGWRPFRLESRSAASQLATIMQYVLGGFGLALAVGWLSRFFNQQTALPMEDLFRSRQSVLLLMALGILVAPVVEETVFRGCIYPVIARKLGVPVGVILTGLLFGIAHAQQLWGGWGEIALLICVGTVLTYVRARAGTVAASYLVHVSYNTILFTGFFFATHGLRYFPPS
jgi:membrane protease YdiL (CAAX protease family)